MPQKKNKIKNLIFDLGGVLIGLDVQRTVKGLGALGIEIPQKEKEREEFFRLLRNFETGGIGANGFRDGLRKYTNHAPGDEDLDHAWKSMLTDFARDTIALIGKIRNRYRISLLSNTNEIHVPYFTRKFREQTGYAAFESLFERVYYSHTLGMRKPEERIFRFVLGDMGIMAGETLFFDDYEENVLAARALGIHAYHYQFGEDVAEIISRFRNGSPGIVR